MCIVENQHRQIYFMIFVYTSGEMWFGLVQVKKHSIFITIICTLYIRLFGKLVLVNLLILVTINWKKRKQCFRIKFFEHLSIVVGKFLAEWRIFKRTHFYNWLERIIERLQWNALNKSSLSGIQPLICSNFYQRMAWIIHPTLNRYLFFIVPSSSVAESYLIHVLR